MEDADYDNYPNDKFIEEFISFSKENRKKFGVVKEKEYWPLEQLYNLLKRSRGGFILDIGQHACLGITVSKLEDGWFEVSYRDPFFETFKKIMINSRTLETNEQKKIKIQWFGGFTFLESTGEQPGFSSLSNFKYKLNLPKDHVKLIQKNTFHCGDISAFLATKSNISFTVPKI
jgi:hypothetical protein